MSGVIDENGQQWEHCNDCGRWVKIERLQYEEPSDQFPHGRDLCSSCAAFARRAARIVRKSQGITLTIPKDFKGVCMGECGGKNDATHTEWLEFSTSELDERISHALSKAGIPTPKGVWVGVCDDCCDKEAKHESAAN